MSEVDKKEIITEYHDLLKKIKADLDKGANHIEQLDYVFSRFVFGVYKKYDIELFEKIRFDIDGFARMQVAVTSLMRELSRLEKELRKQLDDFKKGNNESH